MTSDSDISPKAVEGVIDASLCDESAVFEILQELQLRFPDVTSDAPRRRTNERIEEKGRAGAVAFFRMKWPAETIADFPVEEGIARLSRPETWVANWDDQLVADEKGRDQPLPPAPGSVAPIGGRGST